MMTLMNQIVMDPKNNIPIWAQAPLIGLQAVAVGLAFGLNAPTSVSKFSSYIFNLKIDVMSFCRPGKRLGPALLYIDCRLWTGGLQVSLQL